MKVLYTINRGEDGSSTVCVFHYNDFFLIFKNFFFFALVGHMEGPMLGAESALQPLAYTTATATLDPSRICNLHHSSQQGWILSPLREARDRTCILMDASQICFR